MMLPNFAWMLLPGHGGGNEGAVPLGLTVAESVFRGLALALPCFHALQLTKRFSTLVLAAIALAMGLDYAAWIRYFASGRAAELLSASLMGIRAPLAFAPIAVLILSSYVLESRWMLIVAVIFGALHLWASALRV